MFMHILFNFAFTDRLIVSQLAMIGLEFQSPILYVFTGRGSLIYYSVNISI
jgi:hypothetical protein